jgi:signal peptidase II
VWKLYLAISSSLFLLDVASKRLVARAFYLHESTEVIPGFFDLTYVRNEGVAFGLFRDATWTWKPFLLSAVAVLAVALIIYYGTRVPPQKKAVHTALAAILGGILGNFTDRLINGYVIDFLDFHVSTYHWPTFNVADAAITVGVIVLTIDTLDLVGAASKLGQKG